MTKFQGVSFHREAIDQVNLASARLGNDYGETDRALARIAVRHSFKAGNCHTPDANPISEIRDRLGDDEIHQQAFALMQLSEEVASLALHAYRAGQDFDG